MVTVSRHETRPHSLRAATPPHAWEPGLPCTNPDNRPDWWHATEGPRAAHAKTLCRRCPRLDDCATWATETQQLHGIWGATTPADRQRRTEP